MNRRRLWPMIWNAGSRENRSGRGRSVGWNGYGAGAAGSRSRTPSAGLILAVVVGFILVLWQWRRAEDNFVRADENYLSAERHREEAATRGVESDESFRLAHDVVRDFTGILEESGQLENRGLDPIRRELLLKVQSYYRRFLEQRKHDPTLKLELAQASATLADIIRQIGTPQEALEAYVEARDQAPEAGAGRSQ